MDGWMDGWIDMDRYGWMDGWIDMDRYGWMDGWIHVCKRSYDGLQLEPKHVAVNNLIKTHLSPKI